jgi:hypothetical protein
MVPAEGAGSQRRKDSNGAAIRFFRDRRATGLHPVHVIS